MDLATLIQKVRDLIAAAQAGNWLVSIQLVLEIIKDITGAIPSPSGPTMMVATNPTKKSTLSSCEAKNVQDLLDDLENECTSHQASAIAGAAPQGPFIDAILPILVALLKAWLGF